jgi:site-specific DNA-methyltransferase (adenine-specific)
MLSVSELENRIINADCLDILKQLPDKCVDLVLTDPPYGIKMSKNTNIVSSNAKKGFYEKEIHQTKEWDNKRPEKIFFDEMMRVSKNQIIFGGNYFADMLKPSRGWIVWDKKEHETQGKNFADCELAWTSFDKNIKKYTFGWIGLDYINNRKDEIKIHPTQKPLAIMEKCLADFSNEGDLVLDCFSGSGTTALACHNLKRRFICIEKDKDYYEASVKRLADAQKQLTLF